MVKNLKKQVKKGPEKVYRGYLKLVAPREPKIFCIGLNKTGTTSFKVAMQDLGILVGNQRRAEKLTPYYQAHQFEPIIKYCQTARAFQDAPFCWPDTYRHLYEAYPDALFVLTKRDNAEQWYSSFMRYWRKKFGKLPAIKDLKNSTYVWKGWRYDSLLARRGGEVKGDLWDKEDLIEQYNAHNREVEAFFKTKGNLLTINVAQSDAYLKLCKFIEVEPKRKHFPWVNKT